MSFVWRLLPIFNVCCPLIITAYSLSYETKLLQPTNCQVVSRSGNGITVRWRAMDGARMYRLQLSDRPDFSRVCVEALLLQRRYWVYATIKGLDMTGNYWWRVQAVNPSGASQWSQVISLLDAATLDMPNDLLPAHESTLAFCGSIQLSWSMVDGAHSYCIELSSTPSFDTVLQQINTDLTFTHVTSLRAGAQYYWRVCARESNGQRGRWSPVAQFRIEPLPEAFPNSTPLVQTLNFNTSIDREVYLVWNSTNAEVMITAPGGLGGNVEVFDIVGRKRIDVTTGGASTVQLSLKHIPSGSYTIVVNNRGRRWFSAIELLH